MTHGTELVSSFRFSREEKYRNLYFRHMIAKGGYVYIISNRKRNVLYTGVTNNLYARISQHKQGVGSAWAKNYRCTDLVYYEFHESIEVAIQREKQIKKWKREYKDNIIVGFNPGLLDLYDQVEEMQ